MEKLSEKSSALKEKLCLSSQPIGYKRFDKVDELDSVPGLMKWKQPAMFCQVPFMVRIGFKYPISNIGGFLDPNPLLANYYPREKK